MFDIHFDNGTDWWRVFRYTCLHGAVLGMGIGVGAVGAVLILSRLGVIK